MCDAPDDDRSIFSLTLYFLSLRGQQNFEILYNNDGCGFVPNIISKFQNSNVNARKTARDVLPHAFVSTGAIIRSHTHTRREKTQRQINNV
jgi:hypothetical protein